jgi:orotate phosphoribosyltransferase
MNFDQERFNNFVIKNNIIRFSEEPTKLNSGRMSNFYVNWRTVLENIQLTDITSRFVIDFTEDLKLEPFCFYGVPEGATKLGIITQYKYGIDFDYDILPMGRGKPKEHGESKDRYFLGLPKGETIILEDATTTGSSLMNEIKKLQNENVDIIAAFGLTDRNEKRDDGLTVKEAINEYNIPYFALSNATDLLPLAYRRYHPSRNIINSVEEEFERYGEFKLKLFN